MKRVRAAAPCDLQRGLTLLELAVVLLIALAVLVVAAPNFAGMTARTQAKTAAERLGTVLRTARSQAIAQGRGTALALYVQEGRYEIEEGRRAGRLDQALTVEAADAVQGRRPGVVEIWFFPDGTSSGGEILLGGGGTRYAVTVQWLTGKVDVREVRGNDRR